jgi:hypothetical protein
MTEQEFMELLKTEGRVLWNGRLAYVVDHYTDNNGKLIAVVAKSAVGAVSVGNNVPVELLKKG